MKSPTWTLRSIPFAAGCMTSAPLNFSRSAGLKSRRVLKWKPRSFPIRSIKPSMKAIGWIERVSAKTWQASQIVCWSAT